MRSYRPYCPGDDDAALLRLRADVWGTDHAHTTQNFLRWLYRSGPAGTGGGMVAVDGADMVGFAGILAREAHVQGRSVRVAQCVDFMMHSRARGGATAYRIMLQWAKLSRELGFDFGIGFPNANSHGLVLSGKLRWTDAFWLDHLIRPLSRSAAPQGLMPGVPLDLVRGATGLVKLACLARAACSHSAHPEGHPLPLAQIDARVEALCQAVCASDSYLGLSRSSAYFDWRYLNHPVYRYDLIGWEIGEQLVGCLVASQRQLFGVPSLLLVELLVDPRAPPGVAEALIRQLTSPEQAQKTPMLHALAVPGSTMRDALARIGFVAIPKRANPKRFVMTVVDFNQRSPSPGDWQRWHFQWGDMDVV